MWGSFVGARTELNPAEALSLGFELFKARRFAEAEGLFKAVVEADPLSFHAANAAGLCLTERGEYSASLGYFDTAFKLICNDLLTVTCNRGMALGELGRTEEALDMFKRALSLYPDHYPSWYNHGVLRMQMDDFEGAITDLNRAIALGKDDPLTIDAKYSRGFANLVLGRYAEGFREFEYRKRMDVPVGSASKWSGIENLDGKSILVHGEMGHGDAIQFLRYVPRLVKRRARVYVVVHPNVVPLVQRLEGVVVLPEDDSKWPVFDYWTPIMSLAWCFKTTLETVPPPVPLIYDVADIERWEKRINQDSLAIGLCWSGSPNSKYDNHRSVPLTELAPLFEALPSAQFYSFQLGVRDRDLPVFEAMRATGRLIDLADGLTDFQQTATAMSRLDLMLTCDTSVAHMAGTVGVPTWVMLTAFRTYWLWQKGRNTTPWYPSMTFIRQQKDGDWPEAVSRVARMLKSNFGAAAA